MFRKCQMPLVLSVLFMAFYTVLYVVVYNLPASIFIKTPAYGYSYKFGICYLNKMYSPSLEMSSDSGTYPCFK